MFTRFDRNRSGSISVQELTTVMRQLGQNPTEAEVKEMIAEGDENESHSIDFAEFLKLMTERMKVPADGVELMSTFRAFDQDQNGFISAQELRQVLSNLGDTVTKDEVETMIKEADVNEDGLVNYEEFVKMMSHK